MLCSSDGLTGCMFGGLLKPNPPSPYDSEPVLDSKEADFLREKAEGNR